MAVAVAVTARRRWRGQWERRTALRRAHADCPAERTTRRTRRGARVDNQRIIIVTAKIVSDLLIIIIIIIIDRQKGT